MPFYKELGNQGMSAEDIPVIAFSVGEEELSGFDTGPLVGHLAAFCYTPPPLTTLIFVFAGRETLIFHTDSSCSRTTFPREVGTSSPFEDWPEISDPPRWADFGKFSKKSSFAKTTFCAR